MASITKKTGEPIATFTNSTEGKNHFFHLVEKFQLCQKLSGLYKTDGACFHHGIGICKGACIGKEDNLEYNKRARQLIKSFEYQVSDFYIVDVGRDVNEKAIVGVRNGHYIGFGYLDAELGLTLEQMEDCLKKYNDNRDTQQIIKSSLRTNGFEKIVYVEGDLLEH